MGNDFEKMIATAKTNELYDFYRGKCYRNFGIRVMKTESITMQEQITNDTVAVRKPLIAYFHSGEYVPSPKIVEILSTAAPWHIKRCSSWSELSDVLKLRPAQLAFHIDMVTGSSTTVSEFVSMIETLTKLVIPNKKVTISVVIEKHTPLTIVKELQKLTIAGIVPKPTTFPVDETYKSIDALANGIPYWPKHILQQLPGAVVKPITKNSITLTPRQAEIAKLITERGVSNKKIASILNITESTVKIHVSAILKAYGVRTRTQLAVVANK